MVVVGGVGLVGRAQHGGFHDFEVLDQFEPVVTVGAEAVNQGVDGFPAQAEPLRRLAGHGWHGPEIPTRHDAAEEPPRGLVFGPDEQQQLLVVVKFPAGFMRFALGDGWLDEGARDGGQFPNWPW